MNWIMLVVAFILGAISMFMLFCICHAAKQEEPVNRVHFYVARDKDGTLWLYLGKPLRGDTAFFSGVDGNVVTLTHYNFKYFGLNVNDYANLKWEDEPLEVFVNMDK